MALAEQLQLELEVQVIQVLTGTSTGRPGLRLRVATLKFNSSLNFKFKLVRQPPTASTTSSEVQVPVAY